MEEVERVRRRKVKRGLNLDLVVVLIYFVAIVCYLFPCYSTDFVPLRKLCIFSLKFDLLNFFYLLIVDRDFDAAAAEAMRVFNLRLGRSAMLLNVWRDRNIEWLMRISDPSKKQVHSCYES